MAVEAGILLERIQDLWQEATLENHVLLAGMVEAVYIDLAARVVVGITPKAPSATPSPLERLWFRRRGFRLSYRHTTGGAGTARSS